MGMWWHEFEDMWVA